MDMQHISIACLNVNGLGGLNKRCRVFNYLKQQNYDIIILQETHSNILEEELWQKQWRGRIEFTHGTTDSRGVCTLYSDQTNIRSSALPI